ncbi:MAG: dihydroneopterin aldolase [Bacteroidetes bacterium]|nr:MAG: dihydroneopterin aldolase [Bacteroidota bacterium]
MRHIIEVNGIKLYAFHGCLDEEGMIGGNYVVDVMLNTNFHDAAIEDNLQKTIDYVFVNKIVEEEMEIRSKLIEHVGHRIIQRLKSSFPTIESVRVKVTKISPPINGNVENVAIIIEE